MNVFLTLTFIVIIIFLKFYLLIHGIMSAYNIYIIRKDFSYGIIICVKNKNKTNKIE